MKALWIITGLLLATAPAYAAPKGMRCGHEAWTAASPTDEQKTAAEAFFMPVKKMYEDNKDAIKADRDALKAAFAAQPISKAEVEEAGKNLFTLVMPIRKAGLEAAIDSINLLSVDQRKAFDTAYKACREKQSDNSEESGISLETIDTVVSL